MAKQVTISIPQTLYRRARELARSRHQSVDDVLADVLDEVLPPDDEPDVDASAVARERQAYIALHPMLKQKYLGQHVATYGGQLIDVDADYGALYSRIDAQYPDEFVWLATVAEEPIPTLVFRSPRFADPA
ncbi:MAG TPA: DUF5678 domain-containing protein [Chloroflexota bacterium]|nr:DUF5678 domain-containing protein [Chloroflexota bacterium]